MPRITRKALENDLLLRGVWEGLGTPECHATGGYVRDRLLGKESVDLDLVLPGSLDEAGGPARRLAARLDTRAHVLGKEANRVWRIETPEIRIELWPRGELALQEDIERRDFGFNALIWPLPNGPLDDRVGGVSDLEKGRIRALAKENLEDDPVRLVRAPRFLAQLDGFQIEAQTEHWIRALSPAVSAAPRERTGLELLKLLGAPGVALGLRSMLDLGLFEPAAPPNVSCDVPWIENHVEASSRLAGSADHPLGGAVREAGIAAQLAFLLRGWGSPEADTIAVYAWPRKERSRAARAAQLLEHTIASSEAPVAERRTFIHASGEAFPAAVALAASVEPDRPWARWWRLWRESGAHLVRPVTLLTGKEVAEILDIGHGPELGRAIDALTEAQVRGEVKTANGAKVWLKTYISS
jgi:tRNA nucleotidyltransferase/poly(A) polymerase